MRFIKQRPEGQITIWQRTAMVGKWQLYTHAVLQLYNITTTMSTK